jgi:hypothetical protein
LQVFLGLAPLNRGKEKKEAKTPSFRLAPKQGDCYNDITYPWGFLLGLAPLNRGKEKKEAKTPSFRLAPKQGDCYNDITYPWGFQSTISGSHSLA